MPLEDVFFIRKTGRKSGARAFFAVRLGEVGRQKGVYAAKTDAIAVWSKLICESFISAIKNIDRSQILRYGNNAEKVFNYFVSQEAVDNWSVVRVIGDTIVRVENLKFADLLEPQKSLIRHFLSEKMNRPQSKPMSFLSGH
jgi:hypothetical protein